ncbi:hypothetical protein DLH72_02820 [Candidatus Gracilibacteria bacterium]|nr:MAG: hypothetical protein DLH72_02820 [Candidatus Gracilibacteria bacterium]
MLKNTEKLKKLIQDSKKILLINHIKMDCDAFGSLGALYLLLEKLGKNVKAINDSETPKDFEFLLDKRIIEPELDIKDFDPDLIISLDSASTSQLGEIFLKNEDFFQTKDFVVIDHHQTNPGFGSLNLVFPDYSSTCELLFDIFKDTGLINLIDKKIATLLIAGIHTDTNIFYNQNTTSNTFLVASELVKLGADFRSPIYNFFQKISLKRLKLFGKAISSLKVKKDLVYGKLSLNDFEKTRTSLEDTAGIVNRLSNIEESEVVFMIYETEKGVKVSFRSKTLDIGSFCASFENGGGHKNAAGFYLEKNLDEAEKIILERFYSFFKIKD